MNYDDDLSESSEAEELSDQEIFTKIWASPRVVFRYLNDKPYDKFVTVLLVLAGISRAFDRAVTKNMGDDVSLPALIALCILLGGLLGWITYYLYAAMLSWTGKWFDGQGDTNSLLRMTAHALTPSIVALVLLIPQIALYGNGIFQSEVDIYGSGLLSIIVFYLSIVLEIALALWTIVIFVIGISEVQKISIGKSILNMILPGLIIIVPVLLIALIASLV